MHVSIASFIPCVYWCLVYFCYECLFVTSAGMFKKRANYMDVLLACFLLSFLSIFYFSNSMLVCVCYPGWRVFRTSHTCIYPFPTFPTAFLYVYYFGWRVFRTSHTCIFSLSYSTFPTAILARVMFSERAIHAFFRSIPNFSNCNFIYVYYFSSLVEQVV